ncbi:MAG: DUF58 domain-containing protein [Planctomycetota bacterium]|nr:MAG: DUF58 domain-containing protein [Planctomycetota bacterium]
MAANSPTFLDPQVLARIEGLTFRARAVVEGYVAGLHRSPYHGFSVEFAEHREYAPGDDLRYVDWKVFGRTDKFYVKQFEEETNLTCHLVLDCSAGMAFRSKGAIFSKFDYARCTTAALAYLMIRQQDRVTLQTCGARPVWLRSVQQGATWADLVRVLEDAVPEGEAELPKFLAAVCERTKRRGVVVVVSDFLDDFAPMERSLQRLRHARNDVILIHILDPQELAFDFRRTAMFSDLEGPGRLLVEPGTIRKEYREEIARHCKRIAGFARSIGCDYLQLTTDQPPGLALARYVAARQDGGRF